MSGKKLKIFLSLSVVLIVVGVVLVAWKNKKIEKVQDVQDVQSVQDVRGVEVVQDVQIVENIEIVQSVQDVMLEVPFVLQAPFANWDDPVFQDACEEAAVLMADGWLKNKTVFSKEQMEKGIKEIVSLEKKIIGEYIDTSAKDTAKVLKAYSGYDKVEVFENIAVEDIVREIIGGNLVIVPTDGRKLKNPFYTAPGPITHMIVIIGYDAKKKELITNDSGTKRGEGYRYSVPVIFEAIRDYPTGNHHINSINESIIGKTVIIIRAR